jgi:NAD(P)-dependent dehydrogenase (short-subunit alcohol dehydrogenase family)
MGTMAISGCATGIGAATRKRLEADGHRLIGVDIKDAEVIADLSTSEGRARAISEVLRHSAQQLDGLVLCAGLGGHIQDNARVLSVNYFGAVDLLDGFLPALRSGRDPATVVICSNSAQLSPEFDSLPVVAAMLAGDEDEARRRAADGLPGQLVYMASKHALGRAVRQRAAAWGEAGVRLNAVAPGPVQTPLLQGGLDTPGDGDMIRAFKVPIGRFGEPEEIANIVRFLLGPECAFVHGAIWYADGGADAALRPDRF